MSNSFHFIEPKTWNFKNRYSLIRLPSNLRGAHLDFYVYKILFLMFLLHHPQSSPLFPFLGETSIIQGLKSLGYGHRSSGMTVSSKA